MADLASKAEPRPASLVHNVRFVTATGLFDGHDAAINIMRRLLQAAGVEVIHLGHNRSVQEVVKAAIEEDVQGIAVSSYQGGHIEYFKYMVDLLRENDVRHIKIFGGGGGVIVAPEICELQNYGVEKIYSPEDSQRLGLIGMIGEIAQRADFDVLASARPEITAIGNRKGLARMITALELLQVDEPMRLQLTRLARDKTVPVIGITGTGGAGKSSLTDELLNRFLLDSPGLRVAVLAIDPSRKKTGGALLGDRIRMNAMAPSVFMRSMATRSSVSEVPAYVPDIIKLFKAAGYELIVIETPGIGQGDSAISEIADISIYVMTPEFGAASQLEKIGMLDHADLVAINKFDRKGGMDALRDVRKQMQRNRQTFGRDLNDSPVFGTVASLFNDEGVTAFYHGVRAALVERGFSVSQSRLPVPAKKYSSAATAIVPASRVRYLAEIADAVRKYKEFVAAQSQVAREMQQLRASWVMLENVGGDGSALRPLIKSREVILDPKVRTLLDQWPDVRSKYQADELVTIVREKERKAKLTTESISGSRIPKIALPSYSDDGELVRFLLKENLPGYFPYTAGVFPLKRDDEDPTRMFAGEGDAARTNKRFKFLSRGSNATRLSTAFDSVTLYGFDPDLRPDIYGKVGNSGVSIATLDDMNVLYSGFDLCSEATSVSMTINGPAPTILAMFFNTAINQQLDKFTNANGRNPTETEAAEIRKFALANVRGTVQADILKEDQGQNTCIFSTNFALKVMGDIQQWFIDHGVKNFYSVSISGYHIAEAGANPISQLAFTLANGFTFVESYLARGMQIDDFAASLSFFFSNGMDPEYAVLGRVARRIWAIAMRDVYGANDRSQRLKYHIQTSGRSLHAQEMDFNDIRTTLQALIAIYDNCNSLHTNAHDEAFTTPTAASVRRAIAIQMIINREWGLAKNENPNQGSFIIDELTDLVEEAVLREFERISERGGVLGAMETGYQRGKIQDESLHYEHLKHTGAYPIIGVNTFLNPDALEKQDIVLQRSSDDEKASQLARVCEFQRKHAANAPAALERLKNTVITNGNVFSSLMDAVHYCSLGQITDALFQVGGQYRRNM